MCTIQQHSVMIQLLLSNILDVLSQDKKQTQVLLLPEQMKCLLVFLLLVISLSQQRSRSFKMKKIKAENFLSCLDIETGKLNMIQNVESNIATNRFNDGKVDPCGR